MHPPVDRDTTASLATFIVDPDPGIVPASVRQHAMRCIFNGVGTALGASGDRVVLALLETLGMFSAAPPATVIGNRRQVDMPTAAFLNAAAVNVFDFDDSHEDTIIHPTAPVAPPLLALAEQRTIPGVALLDAFAIGAEVACRIGVAVTPGHYRRGWHITSTCGIFGAAAAVGRLIGLDRQEMVAALGIASALSSGLVETLGSMAKSVGVGAAARGGLLAALMADNGVDGPLLPLEGERGFLRAFCDQPRPAAVTDGLGERWELMRNAVKPYPCGVVLNPVIDACLALHAEGAFAVDAVDRIEVTGHALLKERTDRPGVTTGREAQVSAQHAVAVTLLRGSAGVADFNDAAVADARVLALRARVAPVLVDDAIPVGAARVVVRLAGGRAIERAISEATGSPARPLRDDALKDKFRALAEYGCPVIDPELLMAALWSLEEAPSAGRVMAAARPPA